MAPPRAALTAARAIIALGVLLAFAIGALPNPASAADPDHVSFTLAGCRNDGTITLPNGSGKFICPDSVYTSGNLGKGWNELDLVPHRLTADAGNSAPATQTYTISVVLDNFNVGHPGYDVLSVPTLNTGLSDPGCAAPTVGPQATLAPGLGGLDKSIYRLVTITQAKGKSCVYDFYGRLALGSHLFPGSSLHANLANQSVSCSGIGCKDVSIPVKEITPQSVAKDMTATQNSSYAWNISKSSAGNVSFGDVCAADFKDQAAVSFTVEWTKLEATPGGPVTAIVNIYATNPAARTITVDVIDKIYKGGDTTGTLLDTKDFGPVDVPANTSNFAITPGGGYQVTLNDAGTIGNLLNDVATATYTDKDTGIPVPGQTTATAQATIKQGSFENTTATITDVEKILGAGLSYTVDTPLGGFILNDPADGASVPYNGAKAPSADYPSPTVTWQAADQAGSGSQLFDKTVYLDGKRIVSGTLTDTASLKPANSSAQITKPVVINIDSTASVKLTVTKSIPYDLVTGEKIEVVMHVAGTTVTNYAKDILYTFSGGGSKTLSEDLTGLAPDKYTVTETSAVFYPVGCGTVSCSQSAYLSPQPASVTADLSASADGVVTACSDSAKITNVVSLEAKAAVAKVTEPCVPSSDPAYAWTFDLYRGTSKLETKTANACGDAVTFATTLGDGNYTIVETTRPLPWQLTKVTDPKGTDFTTQPCSFSVKLPNDAGQTKTCTFTNTKQGKAKVDKTIKGAPPTQPITFQLRKDATTTQNGTVLETKVADASNGGLFSFDTWLVPGNHYQLCEILMPGWMTTLGDFVPGSFNPPDGVAPNPNVDNSILCADFTVAAGETKTFTIDNTPPPGGRALTIGFWKNWASCSNSKGGQKPVLDQTMAKAEPTGIKVDSFYLHGSTSTPNVAPDCSKAVALLNKSTFDGKKKASDPLFNMAAQLVAAELNIAAGAGSCGPVTTAINGANALLTKYLFTGNGYTGTLSAADATLANQYATRFDNYNNDRLSACQ